LSSCAPLRYAEGQSWITAGPMVGHTTSTTALVWARASSESGVSVRYATDASMKDARESDPVSARMASDLTVHMAITDLKPDTRYFYELVSRGSASARHTFKTAPANGAKFRVAFGSCAGQPGQTVFRAVRATKADVLLMLGDNVYANASELTTLRSYYRKSRADPDFAAVIADTPTWAIWDDHDFLGNDLDGTAPGKENALAAFREYWANGNASTTTQRGIWHRFTWGNVEFFMLDDRYHRNVNKGSMLGPAQRRWLFDNLLQSTAMFKVIASGSTWNTQKPGDSWNEFPQERRALFRHIAAHNIAGVVLMAGDIHRGEVWRMKTEVPYPLYEFISSPLAMRVSDCAGENPERLGCYSGNMFSTLDVDTVSTPARLRVEMHDEGGKVVFGREISVDEIGGPTVSAPKVSVNSGDSYED
jgi:alkaline phosphatase D